MAQGYQEDLAILLDRFRAKLRAFRDELQHSRYARKLEINPAHCLGDALGLQELRLQMASVTNVTNMLERTVSSCTGDNAATALLNAALNCQPNTSW